LRSLSLGTFCYVYAACVYAGYVYRRSCKHSIALGSRYDGTRPPSPCRTSYSSPATSPRHQPGLTRREVGHAQVLLRASGAWEVEHHGPNLGACRRRLGSDSCVAAARRGYLSCRGHRCVPSPAEGTHPCPLLREELAQDVGRHRQGYQ
jgi:hypothetical protein